MSTEISPQHLIFDADISSNHSSGLESVVGAATGAVLGAGSYLAATMDLTFSGFAAITSAIAGQMLADEVKSAVVYCQRKRMEQKHHDLEIDRFYFREKGQIKHISEFWLEIIQSNQINEKIRLELVKSLKRYYCRKYGQLTPEQKAVYHEL